jgi:hypothetical protein
MRTGRIWWVGMLGEKLSISLCKFVKWNRRIEGELKGELEDRNQMVVCPTWILTISELLGKRVHQCHPSGVHHKKEGLGCHLQSH